MVKFFGMEEWEHWECQDVTGDFPRLQHLCIQFCPKLKGHLPEHLLRLQKLQIEDCEQLVASAPIAPEICELELRDCGKVQFDYHPTTLKELAFDGDSMEASRIGISDGCESPITFPLESFPRLGKLHLSGCHNLQKISQGHAHNHLKHLEIRSCPELESLPERMHILLPSLEFLYIGDCPKVESFPDGGLPSNLKRMDLYNCSKLVASLKGAWGPNPSLEYLYIGRMDAECFPDEGMLPLSLTFLKISDCRDLKQVDYRGLCHLSSLKELHLYNCPLLQCLPEEGLPKSNSTLRIRNCPLLKQRYQKPEGEDWPKIAHIEDVHIF